MAPFWSGDFQRLATAQMKMLSAAQLLLSLYGASKQTARDPEQVQEGLCPAPNIAAAAAAHTASPQAAEACLAVQVLQKASENDRLVTAALNTHGTRAVQKLIETLATREQVT